MFTGHYDKWIESRILTIKKYISTSFFKDKELLELGCGYGHNGNEFYKLGANVICADARDEHLTNGKNLYPHLTFINIDGNKNNITKKYNIILHWGLLYHLNEIENHLDNICNNCDILLLETIVLDSDDQNAYNMCRENGYDQAYNNIGIRPSAAYVEKILNKNNFIYKRIEDPILNTDFHIYDLKVENINKSHKNVSIRKFWICWNKNYNNNFLHI